MRINGQECITKELVEPREFQQMVLDFICSEEFDKHLKTCDKYPNADFTAGFMHGLAHASLMICKCTPHSVLTIQGEADED